MAFLEKLISLAKEEKGLLAVDQSVKQVGPYEQVAVLGAGTYGLVIKAVDTTDLQQNPVAIKLLPRGAFVKEYRRYVLREILHHGNLKHPFIIQLREVFTTPQYLAIVMDYAQGGNLQRFLADRCPGQRLSEQQARWLFQQLIIGLDFCHRMGVANRDLKLDNLLLVRDPQSGNPLLRICDFGYSKHDRSSTLQTQVGTPVYMAPEVVLMSRDYDTKKADVWSCGIILYAMMFGYYPFNPKDPRLPARMMEGNLVYPPEVSTTEECRSLIAGMLRPNPQQRMGVEQVLEHPWFLTDLPEGALTMNSWYLNHVASLEDRVELVQALVDAAGAPGREGEPGLRCAF